jgi:DNA-binding transcriptional LysR family regulator
MPVNERRLRYFVTVADEGQITRAARALHIAQPALSQAIGALEGEVGVPLLERHPRGISLTLAGEEVLEKARLLLEAQADLASVIRSLQQGIQGTIVFGYLGLPPWQAIPDIIERFEQTHPDIEISLQPLEFPISPTSAWLKGVDMAVHAGPVTADPDIWAQPVSTGPRVVLMSHGHPLAKRAELTVAEVLDEVFIGFDPAVDPVWAGAWNLDKERRGPPRQLASKVPVSVQERLAMIAAGSGISTAVAAQAPLISNALPGLVAIPLSDAHPADLSLVGRVDRRSMAVEALLATARLLREGGAGEVKTDRQ